VVVRDISERKAREEALERSVESLTWVGRIRQALAEERFTLYAQPIVEIPGGTIVQHELLIRMVAEGGGIVEPAQFLPVAEEHGLIREIDRWVIPRAVALAAAGHAVELNLSAASLGDPDLYGYFEREIMTKSADPALLVVELTETALVQNEAAAQSFLERIQGLGCRVALDDFGTGYGSFHYLKNLPVDFLKMDIEFVQDLRTNPASRHVVEAVVSLARAFGQQTVAEGVEDAETLRLLGTMGVDLAQGYLFRRPEPAILAFGSLTPAEGPLVVTQNGGRPSGGGSSPGLPDCCEEARNRSNLFPKPGMDEPGGGPEAA
jgi:EAL domain-containing protein (putative c-di-GMP-specific phosphodiesterase class I)